MLGPSPTVVFQHPDFWVINKPIGWTIQRDSNAPSVLEWVASEFGQKGFPVHRLDKPTSGLVIVAATESGNSQLSKQFQARAISKTYLCISDIKPKKKQGWVKGDMAPSRRSQWKLLRTMDNPAITKFNSELIQFNEPTQSSSRGFYLFPATGKTHQLRVAMKSLGAPILGDTLYGGTQAERLHLHAWKLAFRFDYDAFQFQVNPEGGLFDHWPMTDANATKEDAAC